MRIKIKGLTESTVMLNKTGLILRGDEEAVVNIETSEEKAEINELLDCKLIKIVQRYETPKPQVTEIQGIESVPTDAPQVVGQNGEVIIVAPPPGTDSLASIDPDVPTETTDASEQAQEEPVPVVEEVDEPAEPSEEPEEEVADQPTPPKRKRGRPKGSKNKKKAEKQESPKDTKQEEIDKVQEESKATVYTPKGPVQAEMTNSIAGTIDDESGITQASLEAQEKLEQEEEEDNWVEDQKPDEDTLPLNEQMGRPATIASGKGTQSVDMVNSAVPESEQAKLADPFIDREENKEIEEARGESFVKVDGAHDDEDEEYSDAFIEI